jgi:hypothetical protein
MDDVALIHHDREIVQKMLDITDDIAKRYHIQFGKEKSQVITIGKTQYQPQFNLGKVTLDNTESYKYLGMTINKKGNLADHLVKTKGKVEAALQTSFSLAGNDEFYKMEMSTTWRLVHACILPILTHGAETWNPTKAELKEAQRILNNTLKRILRIPTTTPSEIITAETGVWDIETQMDKKQIMYYHKIRNNVNPDITTGNIANDPHNPWMKRVEKTLKKPKSQKNCYKKHMPKQKKL